MHRVNRALIMLSATAAGIAVVILVVQPLWISYGVFARYVLGSPDRYVTEATALLLIPLAFLGLPFAFLSDALPKVTVLDSLLPLAGRRAVQLVNLALMMLIGAFLTYMTSIAALRTLVSGTRSDVLGWPEYPIWFSLIFCMGLFTVLALRALLVNLVSLIRSSAGVR